MEISPNPKDKQPWLPAKPTNTSSTSDTPKSTLKEKVLKFMGLHRDQRLNPTNPDGSSRPLIRGRANAVTNYDTAKISSAANVATIKPNTTAANSLLTESAAEIASIKDPTQRQMKLATKLQELKGNPEDKISFCIEVLKHLSDDENLTWVKGIIDKSIKDTKIADIKSLLRGTSPNETLVYAFIQYMLEKTSPAFGELLAKIKDPQQTTDVSMILTELVKITANSPIQLRKMHQHIKDRMTAKLVMEIKDQNPVVAIQEGEKMALNPLFLRLICPALATKGRKLAVSKTLMALANPTSGAKASQTIVVDPPTIEQKELFAQISTNLLSTTRQT